MCAARLNAVYSTSKMPQTDWDKDGVAFLSNDTFISGGAVIVQRTDLQALRGKLKNHVHSSSMATQSLCRWRCRTLKNEQCGQQGLVRFHVSAEPDPRVKIAAVPWPGVLPVFFFAASSCFSLSMFLT